jgi:hypothetical protein
MMMKNVKLRILYASPHVIRMSKKQKVGWAGHTAGKRQKKIRRYFQGKKYEKSALERRRRR